jgi:hypothetical protein
VGSKILFKKPKEKDCSSEAMGGSQSGETTRVLFEVVEK